MTQAKQFNWAMAGVVLALLTQTGGMIWWGSSLNERVANLEAKTAPLTEATASLKNDLGRLDERTSAIKEGVARIERKLETAPHY